MGCVHQSVAPDNAGTMLEQCWDNAIAESFFGALKTIVFTAPVIQRKAEHTQMSSATSNGSTTIDDATQHSIIEHPTTSTTITTS
ncbi:MAG: hypothetical protein D4R92_02675 [Actinobacteria bacterium]|nr:MAG: hypothetical protein D4R92_02675 [Actinomycetota bacterium]